MNEEKLKEKFEQLDHEFKIELKKEVLVFDRGRIDYTAKRGDKIIGIEVKGSRTKIYGAIGQLIFMKRFFSELYLLAPMNFIKKLNRMTEGIPFIDEIGLMTLAENSIIILKHPNSEKYYYNSPPKEIKQKTQPKLQAIVNENDVIVIKLFRDRVFTAADVSKELNLSRENAYRRITRLKKAGIIKQVETGSNPKSYKIVRYVEEPEFIINT